MWQGASYLVFLFEGKPISGVESFIAEVVVEGSMEAAPAALGNYVNDGAGTLAIFGLIAVLQHLHLRDGIHVQGRIQIRTASGIARDAIHVHAVVVAAGA